MVTITLSCLPCRSEALVRDGHAPNGKQKYRCHACGRRSRENPTPNAYPETRREEILHASQERSSLRGLTRTFGVSGATVSSWMKKKELSFLLYGPPCSLPTQRMPLPRLWNSMNCGRLCFKKRTTPGFGSPCAERAVKWSPLPWVIGGKRPVNACGRPFQRGIVRGIVSATRSRHMRR
jgi:hypothetical protein